jgi:hypothetical protein
MSAQQPESKNEPPRSCGSDAVPCSPSCDAPETLAAWDTFEKGGKIVDFLKHTIRMERERDELRSKYATHHAEAENLTAVIRSATILIAAKGRHNTMLAYEGLRAALSPENDKTQAPT